MWPGVEKYVKHTVRSTHVTAAHCTEAKKECTQSRGGACADGLGKCGSSEEAGMEFELEVQDTAPRLLTIPHLLSSRECELIKRTAAKKMGYKGMYRYSQ
jgi:hypothetical protein